RSIVENVDRMGAQTDFTGTTEVPRTTFAKHPWSIGGGGAAELKEALDQAASTVLGDHVEDVGRTTHTGEDDAYYFPPHALVTRGLMSHAVLLVAGGGVRDWMGDPRLGILFPYRKHNGGPS